MSAAFVRDGVGHIPLYGRDGEPRAWALVDSDLLDELASVRWHLSTSGYAMRWYGGRLPKRKGERMHRRVLGLAHGDPRQADHINRDKLDNRRSNLRIVGGDAQNRQNVPARGGTSRYRGVSFDAERGKWIAQAKCKGTGRLVRRFDTELEAAEAARAWRREHMPFATD